MLLGPRLVIAGTHSGVGKTTVATGLMAALRRRGRLVAAAKVGPDFIDPGYHALACGRPARNLNAWMSGSELVSPLAARAMRGAEILIVEGVMGLFDGAADGTPSSTADVALLLDAPVVLVVDCSAQAGSVAALVHGFATFNPRLRLAGVVLNRLASDGHERTVRDALSHMASPPPVVGALRREDALTWRDRHLGLVPVAERPGEVAEALDRLAARIAEDCELSLVEAIASAAPLVATGDVPMPQPSGAPRLAVATGKAFTFSYPDNIEALEAAGAEIVPFDPLHDPHLPDGVDGLIIGGGFPEVMAAQLAANVTLLAQVRRRVEEGLVVWAECGGLLWLARSLDGHPMCDVLAADGVMTQRLSLGYRVARTRVASPVGPAGTPMRGHEFHYSTADPAGNALELTSSGEARVAGFATRRLLASYLHVHLAGQPHLAEAFVRTAASGV